MRRLQVHGTVLALATLWLLSPSLGHAKEPDAAKEPMIVHDVFFALKDSSPEEKDKLVEACKKYLSKHHGEVFFAVGTRCGALNREVNDKDFDVGLHIVFRTKKAHDDYQTSERHLKFIAENKENWKKVRVFDSAIQP